jgi:predicted short-subunit dehydrogenase-like oxidoreductase (DUF2520 family)
MPTAFAVIGPGKVGQALARRWREAGYHLLGFFGGSEASRAAATRFAGGVALTQWTDLARATVVLLAVPDAAIGQVAARAAGEGAVRPCALWLHGSGATTLSPLQPLADAGARVGSMHPLCPFPSAQAGYDLVPDKIAVLDGARASQRLLAVLARAAKMRPLTLRVADRTLYHAACALAANGVTVVHHLAATWLAATVSSSADDDVRAMVGSLMTGALRAASDLGAAAALTGPAARGDAVTLAHHLQAAAARRVAGRDAFIALMRHAAAIAHARGELSAAAAARVVAALEAERDG